MKTPKSSSRKSLFCTPMELCAKWSEGAFGNRCVSYGESPNWEKMQSSARSSKRIRPKKDNGTPHVASVVITVSQTKR